MLWDFNYAYITTPNGKIIEVVIDSLSEGKNFIIIKDDNGQVYLVSYHNCMLTKERWDLYD